MNTPTPEQETALAHLRDRYPDLAHHTEPSMQAAEALVRVAAQTQRDPRSVDQTTTGHALRLTRLAQQGTKLATLTLLSHVYAQGATYTDIAIQSGYGKASQAHQRMERLRSQLGVREIDFPVGPDLSRALQVAHRHFTHTTLPTPLRDIAAPLFAVWLLHRPRPNLHTWLKAPTPHPGITTTATIVNRHALLPPGTRADLTNLILASHTTAKDPHP